MLLSLMLGLVELFLSDREDEEKDLMIKRDIMSLLDLLIRF